jgi:hypothetical protein
MEEEEDILEEDVNPIFNLKPSDFPSDSLYTKAIIKEVKRKH